MAIEIINLGLDCSRFNRGIELAEAGIRIIGISIKYFVDSERIRTALMWPRHPLWDYWQSVDFIPPFLGRRIFRLLVARFPLYMRL